MSSLVGSSHGGSGSGSLTASGEVSVSKKLDGLDGRELENNELNLYIMQEFTPCFLHLHYLRLRPWKYKREPGKGFAYNSFRGSKDDTHGRLLKHDSVVVQYGAREWIKGEKGGEDSKMKKGGIRVYKVENEEAPVLWEDEGDEGPGRYSVRFGTGRINLGEGKVKWTVKKLKELLAESDKPRYHFLYENCWKYAYLSAKAVLEWVIKNAKDEQVKNQVQEKLDQLEGVNRPQPGDIWRALHRRATSDRAVLVQYCRKLSHTCAHLPSKSHVRKRACRRIKGFVISRCTTTRSSDAGSEISRCTTRSSDAGSERIKDVVISRCTTRSSDAGSESARVPLVRRGIRRRLRFPWRSSAQENVLELCHSKHVEVSAPSDQDGPSDEGGASDEDEAEPQDRAMARSKMGRCRTIEARHSDRRIKMGRYRRIEPEPQRESPPSDRDWYGRAGLAR